MPSSRYPTDSPRSAMKVVAVATVLLGAAETIRTASGGRVSLLVAALQNLPWWLLWILLTPVIARWSHVVSAKRLRPALGGTVHFILAMCLSVAHLAVAAALLWPLLQRPERYPTFLGLWSDLLQGYLLLNLMTYGAIAGVIATVESQKRLHARERESAALALRTEQLEREVITAKLEALQRQLNPHFLFNCLNAIAGLSRAARHDTAVTMIAALGQFLRDTLAVEGRHFISLEEEIRLAQSYIAIERIRFGDRVTTAIAIPPDLAARVRLPPLLLQPLFENAYRHGLANSGGSAVITLSTVSDGERVTLRLSNKTVVPGAGLQGAIHSDADDPAGMGIGLRNVRARLATAYGARAFVEISHPQEGHTVVEISLPTVP